MWVWLPSHFGSLFTELSYTEPHGIHLSSCRGGAAGGILELDNGDGFILLIDFWTDWKHPNCFRLVNCVACELYLIKTMYICVLR